MKVNLTEGAVGLIINRKVSSDKELKPVLQVVELKEVRHLRQQEPKKSERYKLLLSDGSLIQPGMLATNKNQLVKSSKLQVGSIVLLAEYVCSVIQDRMIVSIVDLEVIVEKYDIIGKPVPSPRSYKSAQVPIDQPGTVMVQTNSLGGSSVSGCMADRLNLSGTTIQQPRMNQLHGSSYLNKSEPLRNPAVNLPPIYSKADSSAGFPGSSSAIGPYGIQFTGFPNHRPATSCPLRTSNCQSIPAYEQPSPMYTNRGPVTKNEVLPMVIPISALNPYQGWWTIKARVTAKGDLKRYNNARSEGKLFFFNLLDSDGGEIRVTCFNDVVDRFYNQIEAGKVYLISRGSLRPAQKTFNHLNNDYEIFLDSSSIIQPCYEDDNTIPRQQFNFHTFSDVEGMENNTIVDIIGVVSAVSPASSIMRKTGAETQKRTVHLKDMSGQSIELTLWGAFCDVEGQKLQSLCDSGEFPVLAVKTGRVSDFNGKVVGTVSTTQLFIDPDFAEAHRLKEWFISEGRSTHVSISRKTSSVRRAANRKMISQIKDEKLGTSEKPDWITVIATIANIKLDNFCYTACPIMNGDRQCNKKVTNNGDGMWWCDNCNRLVDECDYKYLIQFQIQDYTSKTWVTAFQESGEDIMGLSAKDLCHLRYENPNDEKFMHIKRRVMFNKYTFQLKVKQDTFNGEQRVKSIVEKVEEVNFSSESRNLLDLIYKLEGNDSNRFASKAEITTSGRIVGHATSDECYKCHQTGHWAKDCPRSGPSSTGSTNFSSTRSSSGTTSNECYKCHQTGHWAKDCPRSGTPFIGSTNLSFSKAVDVAQGRTSGGKSWPYHLR
ncbi:hypothetical protein PTKIN_Ptkin05aG0003200 [Pterospermum kingtungense]